MYGLDGPALLLMPPLWLIAGLRPPRWRWYAAALAVDAVFVVTALGDLGWFLDSDKRWLHAALAVLPAAAVCAWTLPPVIRSRETRPPAGLGRSSRPAQPRCARSSSCTSPSYRMSGSRSACSPLLSSPPSHCSR